MPEGSIYRSGGSRAVGRWSADSTSFQIETDDPELKRAADEILTHPQAVPVHGADRFEFAAEAVPVVERPASVRYLALVALELETRGFTMEPDEE